MASEGKSYFFSDRNTAVRGAEVHSLPLNFPLKKAGYGLQAHGIFGTELSTWCFGLETSFLNYNFPGGWKAEACAGFAQTKGKHLT